MKSHQPPPYDTTGSALINVFLFFQDSLGTTVNNTPVSYPRCCTPGVMLYVTTNIILILQQSSARDRLFL